MYKPNAVDLGYWEQEIVNWRKSNQPRKINQNRTGLIRDLCVIV